MTAASCPHVVVLGAGIFGVSSAVHLLRLGARVTLVTEASPANGASGRSLSWLNSARARSPEYHRLRMIGIDRYRTLAARHPDARWLRFDGGLTWDANDGSNGIATAFAHEQSIGYDTQLLPPEAVAAVTPGVDARAITPQGAIFNPGEGWVDIPSLIRLLLGEFRTRGGQLLEKAGSASIKVVGARAIGVVTAAGETIGADTVLLAAGAAVPKIVAASGVCIPDATPISLLVKAKPIETALRAVLNTPRVAIRPAPGGSLVFDSAWSEAEVAARKDETYEVRESTLQGLLREASAVLAGNPTLELESYGVGPKPIPGDGEPVVGQLGGIAGYYIVFSHSGATLGLILGELLASEIVTGMAHPLLTKFRPARFG